MTAATTDRVTNIILVDDDAVDVMNVKRAFARGNMKGELADIARIGNAFRPLPDSGTASNLITQVLLSGGAGLTASRRSRCCAAGPCRPSAA